MSSSASLPGRPWPVFGLTAVATFVVSLDATALFVAFPAIRASYPGVSAEALSWVLSGYTVAFAALLVPLGRVADLVGRRRTFAVGAVGFALASLACGLAPDALSLVLARVVQGVFAAALVPAGLALVLHAFPIAKRPIALSLAGAVGALAAALGPSLGALLVEGPGWRSVFLVNVPLALAAGLAVSRVCVESRDERARGWPDPVGILLAIAAATLLALGVVELGAWGPFVCAWVLALGIAASVLFVRRTRSVASPAIDLSLFDSAAFSRATLAALFFGVSFTAMFLGFVFFLEDVWRYSPLEAGLAITPGPLVVMPTAAVAGRIASTRGHRGVLVVGSVLYGAGGLALALALPASPAFFSIWLPTAVLTGLGVGLVLPSLQAAALHGVGMTVLGTASAIHQATRQLGSILGVALAIVLVEILGTASFPFLFGVMPLAAAVVAALSLGIDTRPSGRAAMRDEVPVAVARAVR